LFSLKSIKSKSAQELNGMMITITESLGALEALNCHTDEMGLSFNSSASSFR